MNKTEIQNRKLYNEYFSTINTQLISKGVFIFQTNLDEDDIDFQLDCNQFEKIFLMEVLTCADEVIIEYYNDEINNQASIIEILEVLECMVESSIPWSVDSKILLDTKRLGIKSFNKELKDWKLDNFYQNNKIFGDNIGDVQLWLNNHLGDFKDNPLIIRDLDNEDIRKELRGRGYTLNQSFSKFVQFMIWEHEDNPDDVIKCNYFMPFKTTVLFNANSTKGNGCARLHKQCLELNENCDSIF